MMKKFKPFGQGVKAKRQGLGLSVTTVANAVHLSYATYRAVESGNRLPAFETAQNMCRFLGADWLVDRWFRTKIVEAKKELQEIEAAHKKWTAEQSHAK